MSTLVRIALDNGALQLAWPQRCPACGTKDGLVPSTHRVGQVKSVRPNLLGGITLKSNVLYLPVPMCSQHAGPNALATRILEKSPLMRLLRGLSYLFGLMAVTAVLGFFIRRGAPSNAPGLGIFSLLPLLGVVGCAAIVWAGKTSSVRPVRFDPDVEVIEVDFRDPVYAAEFKRVNRETTDSVRTQAPPWYRRSGFLKGVVLLVFVLVMWRLLRGA